MGKSNKLSRSSAVRKIDPVTDEVMEMVTEIDRDPVTVAVLESSSAVVSQEERSGVNPIAAAGHTIEGLSGVYKTKSGVIRFLASQGFATKHIAVWMGIRYQHVRNVLTVQLKKPVSLGGGGGGGGGGNGSVAPAAEVSQPDEPETE